MTDLAATAAIIDRPVAGRYARDMDARTEQILLQQAREGVEAGFEQLVAAHGAFAINLALRLVGHRQEAEDIAQEAFLRLHRSLKEFRGDSRITTWLYRTVSRLAIDHLRRERIKRRLFLFRTVGAGGEEEDDPLERAVAPDASPEEALLNSESGLRLQQALTKLSARQRTVFALRHFEGLPLKEIGAILGLEEGTVKSHLHRAVSLLRSELEEYRS